MKVQVYKYKAYSENKELVTGTIHAASKNEAIMLLQSRSLAPISLSEDTDKRFSLASRKISRQDLIDFTEALATLVEADIPLDRSLLMLREISGNKKMGHLVDNLRQQVKEGSMLAEAMKMYPEVFPDMYIYMIQAGEENGILKELLPRLENFLLNEQDTRNQVISALIYPVILGVVGFLSVLLLLTFVVPRFATVFEGSGAILPASTMFLLWLSSQVRHYGWAIMLLPGILFFLLRYINAAEEFREKKDDLLLHVPLFGNILLLKESASLAKTMGALLRAGVPLARALSTTKSILRNRKLRNDIDEIEKNVRGGMSLGYAFQERGTFPDLLSQLITVGEESGSTAEIFEKLGDTFDKNVKKQTERFVALLEPFMILTLGIVVGGIVIIMLSSVMSMNDIGM